jgi:hypothetical protein
VAEPTYTIRFLGLAPAGSLQSVAAFVTGRSSLDGEQVRARLERPPVLLLRRAGRVGALEAISKLAARGARLSVSSGLSGVCVDELPEGDWRPQDEVLKLWLADCLEPGEAVRYAATASSALRLPEYASAGGLPSYLARCVLLLLTNRRLLVAGLKAPSGRPAQWLQSVDLAGIAGVSRRAGKLVVSGVAGPPIVFNGLNTGSCARLAELLEADAPAHRGPSAGCVALCRVCGFPLLRGEAGAACERCGRQRLRPGMLVLKSLALPGSTLAAQARIAAAAVMGASSALVVVGLVLWLPRARAAGLGWWSWCYTLGVWLAWSGSHALSEWSRHRDESRQAWRTGVGASDPSR